MMDEPALATIGDGFASSYGGGGAGSSAFGGDGAGSPADIFLSSEFGQIEVPLSTSAAPAGADLLVDDLKKMLASCRERGIADLELVWCLGTSHFSWTETPDKESSAGSLLGRVPAADRGEVKPQASDRSVVLKMAPKRENTARLFVSTPRSDEPSSAAISAVRDADDGLIHRSVTDSEVSALFALALTAMEGSETEGPTLIVRIGEEDVLVLIVQDRRLSQVDVLRSLSVHDGADMICSRVLLLHDEHGLNDLERIYVAGGDDARFADSFRTYFQQAAVVSLTDEIGRLSSTGARLDAESMPATGAALRAVLDLTEDDNMLPEPLRLRRRTIPYSWEVWALLAVLSFTVIFFVARFITQENDITARHERIEALTHDVQTATLLQQRIDSLQIAYSVNMSGLEVLDSLLIGSDKWSRTFDHVSGEMFDIENIWIEKWQPAGSIVALTGASTSRDRVANLAHRLNGTIDEIRYPNEENVHYLFRMKVPLMVALPEAAQYLRERATDVGPRQEEVSKSILTRHESADTPTL